LFPSRSHGQGVDNQIVKAWITKKNSKVLPTKYANIPSNDGIQVESLYIANDDLTVDEAKSMGIKPVINLNFSVNQRKKYLVNLDGASSVNALGHKFVIAIYKDKDGSYPCLYLRKPGKPEPLLTSNSGCDEIHLLQPGKKAPIFVLFKKSGCASGTSEGLYSIEKDGRLKLLKTMGGWFGGIVFENIDEKGNFEIIDTYNLYGVPKDLKALIQKQIKNFDDHSHGPILRYFEILKWTGIKLVKVGEYYGVPE
jgi:hypothetical protein